MHRAWLPATAIIASLAACAGPAPAPTRAPPPPADRDRAIVDRLRGAPSLFTLRGEEQRVAFRRLDELVPVNIVRRGPYVEPLVAAARDFSRFRYRYRDATRTIDDFMAAMNVVGLLVLVDDEIVLERYAHGNTARTRWLSFSVTKSVVSMLFGAALRDGSIKSLDAKVTDYVPELAGSAYDDVTLRHLLQMSSGVQWSDDELEDIVRMMKLRAEGGFAAQLAYMKTLPRKAPAGTVFKYSTHEADVAGAVLKAATGRTMAEYLSATIWQPFGMQGDAAWVRIPGTDLEFGGCCLMATLRDYGRLGLLALRDGVTHDGTRVVPAGWFAASTRPSPAAPHYGYYWWLRPNGRYFASGMFGQHIEVAPAERVVVAIHSHWPAPVTDELIAHNDAFVTALVDAAAAPARK